MDIKSSLRPRS